LKGRNNDIKIKSILCDGAYNSNENFKYLRKSKEFCQI
jgi:hypothetical protein